MADYNLICANCLHGPHQDKVCTTCLVGNSCNQFVRADVQLARVVTQFNSNATQFFQQTSYMLATIVDLFAEAFPDAALRLNVKREKFVKEQKEKAELERQQTKQEVDEAYKQKATEGQDRDNNIVSMFGDN
jgi:hypothetical protein